MTYRIDQTDLIMSASPIGPGWQRLSLPAEAGAGHTDRLQLADGLALALSDITPRHDLIEDSVVERASPALTITVALDGRSSCLEHEGARFDFLAGHTTVASFARARAKRRFVAGERVRQLRVIADEALLVRYGRAGLFATGSVDGGADHLFFGATPAGVQAHARTLAQLHARQGDLMDMHIGALGLLAEQCRQLHPQPSAAMSSRAASDADRVARAHALMQEHYARPLTIAYLAAAVGLNEFKLKQGIRAHYGTSPHRLLTDIRMRHARDLLEAGERVSTVTHRVGYQHLASFSAAFSSYYGHPPKSVRMR
ncbi:helix-turn-helix transcriptional regulator [Pseudomonadota bacterium AL_CKDN230030165-1A_HGKHYDSX7]